MFAGTDNPVTKLGVAVESLVCAAPVNAPILANVIVTTSSVACVLQT